MSPTARSCCADISGSPDPQANRLDAPSSLLHTGRAGDVATGPPACVARWAIEARICGSLPGNSPPPFWQPLMDGGMGTLDRLAARSTIYADDCEDVFR